MTNPEDEIKKLRDSGKLDTPEERILRRWMEKPEILDDLLRSLQEEPEPWDDDDERETGKDQVRV